MPRTDANLLVTPAQLAGERLTVEGEAYHHLFRARRLAVGDRLRLLDGVGGARAGRVVAIDRRSATVTVGDPLPSREPSIEVRLLVAALRPERAAWLVEKATELGVAAIDFIGCERTPRQYGELAVDRLRRIAAAAVEQCGRARLPAVAGIEPWSALPGLLAGCARVFLLDPACEGPARGVESVGSGSSVILVGPEGGFTERERAEVLALGARPWRLGERVLRVETAAIAALACLLIEVPA